MSGPPIAAVALDYAAMLEIVMLCVIIAGIVLISFMMRNHVTRATLTAVTAPLQTQYASHDRLIEGLVKMVQSHEGRIDELVRSGEQHVVKGELDAVTREIEAVNHGVRNARQDLVTLNTRMENYNTSIKGEIQRVDAGIGRVLDHLLSSKKGTG